MYKTRLEKWKTPERVPAFLEPPSSPEAIEFERVQSEKRAGRGGERAFSELNVLRIAKEVIFDVVGNKRVLHYIVPILDLETFEIAHTQALRATLEGDEMQISRDIRRTLAFAIISDVPVYPNTERVAPELTKHFRDLVSIGFELKYEGTNRLFKLAEWLVAPVEGVGSLLYLSLTRMHSIAELTLIRDAVAAELHMQSEASQLLARLRLAIAELNRHLKSTRANEHALQRCLTNNPILFGTEYVRVISKHRLGAEFEMDYALERRSGIVDLVEIESSTRPVFTKKGDPTKYLVHAEQQVLDWLGWIEQNHAYARKRLSGLMRPRGFVVIGRSAA